MSKIRTVKGTHDILEEDSYIFDKIISRGTNLCKLLNYNKIQTPILEFSNLFSKTLGLTSDVVSKEMFSFVDQGSEHLTLRPEGTAPLARALMSNSLYEKQNQKFFYFGPMFRREKPQAGRLRQFNQFGIEVFNQSTFFCDLEVIFLANELMKVLNISKHVRLEINTIGNFYSRQKYKEKLVEYLEPFVNDLSEESKIRLKKNPLRILDSKEQADIKILKESPKIKDFLDKTSIIFYDSLKEFLIKLKVDFTENLKLVRGLDYYNHSVFEFVSKEEKSQNTVLAGGRYDGLVETISGKDICGVGWAAGIERIALMINQTKLEKKIISIISTSLENNNVIFVVLKKLIELKEFSFHAIYEGNLKKKFVRANKLNSMGVLVIGDEEIKNNQLLYKDFSTGEQELVEIENIKNYFQEKLKKN